MCVIPLYPLSLIHILPAGFSAGERLAKEGASAARRAFGRVMAKVSGEAAGVLVYTGAEKSPPLAFGNAAGGILGSGQSASAQTVPSAAAVVSCRIDFVRQSPAANMPGTLVRQSSAATI